LIEAVIFDFDGLILDTETAEWESWCEVYAEYGFTLPFSIWADRIGTSANRFDPITHLEQLLRRKLFRTQIQDFRRKRLAELLDDRPPLPGVENYLQQAEELELIVGLASASPSQWVRGHLSRLGLEQYFDCIRCADHVQRVKPDPEVYQLLIARWNISSHCAIALEDSPHGVQAAKQAGLFSVAVPNFITAGLSFDHSDLILQSLSDIPLTDLLTKAADAAHNA
jgi:HAD superfamily hydrolase (TIGR01509 family)